MTVYPLDVSADPISAPLEPAAPVVRLRGAALAYGPRTLWQGLDLDVRPGEFLAVLGPNGSGKTSLLRVLLGLTRPAAGQVEIGGHPARAGDPIIGYVPQQQITADRLSARDLVRLGVDGHRWGPGRGGAARRRAEELLRAVGALSYADAPLGMLSGGEQQRVRIAQALAADPAVLLCDEPLLSLDLQHQRAVVDLLDARRRAANTAIVMVTHEINPILNVVNRILFLAPHGFRVGEPGEILTSAVLTELYGTPVEVVRTARGVAILGLNSMPCH